MQKGTFQPLKGALLQGVLPSITWCMAVLRREVCTHCREIPINNMDIHLQKHDENVKFAPKTVTKHYYYEKV